MKLSEDLSPLRLLDERQAAELLGLHRGTLSNWRSRGRGPKWVRAGRSIRYAIRHLEEWQAANTGGGER